MIRLTSRTDRRLSLGLAAAIVVALAVACFRTSSPAFPHAVHLTAAGCGGPGQPECLSCASCHGDMQRRDEPALPATAACTPCHEEPRLLAAAERAPSPQRRRANAIRFSHGEHLAMSGLRGQCVPCHGGVVRQAAVDAHEVRSFPTMAKCLECHEHRAEFDSATCTNCHRQSDLTTLLPQTFLRHDHGWRERHGAEAARAPEMCAQCHSQAECDDCHAIDQSLTVAKRYPDAIERDLVHRADFVTRHALEAKANPGECVRCHSPPSCDKCHVERGVSAGRAGAVNPHPPGWVGGNPAAPDFHGRAARRALNQCAACHDQGPFTNCIRCHKVGGPGGSPHPSGWQSSQARTDEMCRYCHAT